MSFDALGFLQHYGIPYVTEGHKHSRHGWIQVTCPFCTGNPGWHLGFNIDSNWWNCYRCGYHRTWDVVLEKLGGNKRAATEAMTLFRGRPTRKNKRISNTSAQLELPPDLTPLTSRAKKYLKSRNFNPDMLEALWGLKSTSNIGNLKYRIFIPIHVNAQMVSWQCRDITDRSPVKYLAQQEAKEIVNNKDTLYGLDQATSRVCAVVEGVTGTWRLGPGCVATFGIKYRPTQVAALLSNFDEFHLLFDPDPQAIVQAEKLGAELALYNRKVKIWYLDEYDTGDMPQDEADSFMREIGAGGY